MKKNTFMKRQLKNILCYSIVSLLLFASGPCYFAEEVVDIEATTSTTDEEQTENSFEILEESKTEDTEKSQSSEKDNTKKIQIGARSLGGSFKPEHLLMNPRLVRFNFHTPDGTPIEGLDFKGEMVAYLAGNTLPTGYPINLTYNNTTHLYEGMMDYPHPIPLTTTTNQGVALQVKIENIPSVTAITEDYPNTYTIYERRTGTSSLDPDNVLSGTSTANVQLTNWGSGTWGKRLDDSETFSAVVWASPTPISNIASIRNVQTTTPYSHTLKINMSEHFVDDQGNSIPAPTGFSNNRQ